MIRINQIRLSPDHSEDDLINAIIRNLHIRKKELLEYKIVKKSIDARKGAVHFCYSVDVSVGDERKVLSKVSGKNIMSTSYNRYIPKISGGINQKMSPVVVGSGPAGLFCAYLLALYGYRPIVIERGECVEDREKTVERFWKTGVLNTESNVQFGEGGAGTFSDGKLNTLIKDKTGRNGFVLETFVKFGAPESILYVNKPHIGTDILRNVVKNMRMEIERLGGKVRFNTCLTDIEIEQNTLKGIAVNNSEKIDCDIMVLAPGHSSRDTFKMLADRKIFMQSKSFAVGVRVQHPQKMIDSIQYKTDKFRKYLPAAEYKVTANLMSGRGVYSFCMCPGGYVVNSSSEKNMIAINGMSYSGRNGKNANSAIIVTVTPDDFSSDSPLAGMEFQRKLERLTYNTGRGRIPVQLLCDFNSSVVSRSFGDIVPEIKGQYDFGNLRDVFPEYVSRSITEGMDIFAQKIKGFNRPDTILAGVESRTSSPVRIVRDETLQSNISGIYPCGEGAGYAGGITSAAMDGIKVFDAISAKMKPLF